MESYGYAEIKSGEIVQIHREHPRPRDRDSRRLNGWEPDRVLLPCFRGDRPELSALERIVERVDIQPDRVLIRFEAERVSEAEQIKAVKFHAGWIIESHVPAWKQRNLVAEDNERARADLDPRPESVAAWDWVKRTRAHCGRLVDAILAGELVDLESGTSASVAEGWPEFAIEGL